MPLWLATIYGHATKDGHRKDSSKRLRGGPHRKFARLPSRSLQGRPTQKRLIRVVLTGGKWFTLPRKKTPCATDSGMAPDYAAAPHMTPQFAEQKEKQDRLTGHKHNVRTDHRKRAPRARRNGDPAHTPVDRP
jgi:hypothetical protein